MFKSRAEIEDSELRKLSAAHGAELLCDCVPGDEVTACGIIRTMTIRPKGSVPALEVELYDGSKAVTVIWLGRRRILGVDPGRGITVHGRLTGDAKAPVIFNPKYELHPRTA